MANTSDNQTMGDALGTQALEPQADAPNEVYRLKIYPATQLPEQYHNLVVAPFLNSLRYGNDLFKLIDKEAYYSAYSRFITILLSRPMCAVKLAVLEDDTVLGWSMYEGKTLHYVWVKKEVRRQGIGRSLLPEVVDTISHVTNKGLNIWVNKWPEWRFNPFA